MVASYPECLAGKKLLALQSYNVRVIKTQTRSTVEPLQLHQTLVCLTLDKTVQDTGMIYPDW